MEKQTMEKNSNAANHACMARIIDSLIPKEARPENVGPRIAAARQALGLKPAAFADSIGLDRSSLTRIEAGRMGLSIGNALKIETLYGIGIRYTYRHDFRDLPEELRDAVRRILESQDSAM